MNALRRESRSLRVGVTREGVRLPVANARIEDAVRSVLRAEGTRQAMISVTCLAPRAMAQLNSRHLRHRGATDVISFGLAAGPDGSVLGDIYVCPAIARTNATRAGCGVREELLRLVVHGTLHVLGWDHPVDASREQSPMWRRQEQLLARLLRLQARTR